MKKLGLTLIMGFFLFNIKVKSQEQMVNNLSMLQNIGYTVNTSEAVVIGNVNGHTIYRTNYATFGKCKGNKKIRLFCKNCPGCCNSGYVDYDETGRIYGVNVDGQRGQLFYDQSLDIDYFIEQSKL
jgi:hypothetical protein